LVFVWELVENFHATLFEFFSFYKFFSCSLFWVFHFTKNFHAHFWVFHLKKFLFISSFNPKKKLLHSKNFTRVNFSSRNTFLSFIHFTNFFHAHFCEFFILQNFFMRTFEFFILQNFFSSRFSRKFNPKKKLLHSKNFTRVNFRKILKFTNWFLHENPQRLIHKIFRMRKSCTGVGAPRSCGFHAKIYNNFWMFCSLYL